MPVFSLIFSEGFIFFFKEKKLLEFDQTIK